MPVAGEKTFQVGPNTPVLVGVGVVSQRENNVSLAREPAQLMIDAAKLAGEDASGSALLQEIDRVYVPQGRWRYRDPGRIVAHTIGCKRATTVLAKIGILQQSLIGDACQRIAKGDIRSALIVGGEGGYRLLRSKITDQPITDTQLSELPDVTLEPDAELMLDVEVDSGLGPMPVGYYAIIESAIRADRGLSIDKHRDIMADLYSRFSAIAAINPHAWGDGYFGAASIRDAAPKNPMIAFPYTKLHTSSWNVDQAAALLFCSASKAADLNIPRAKWVFPLASTESNYMTNLAERTDLAKCPGARIAGQKALQLANLNGAELDFVELYSCFPAAVEICASELGLDLSRDLTVTGGMPFAGGPLNNYVLQATARMAELLRTRPSSKGLVSSISGVMTKQGFGVWSNEERPVPFSSVDVSSEVERSTLTKPVTRKHSGPGRVAGYTVMFKGDRPHRGIAVVDIDGGRRVVAYSDDPSLIDKMLVEEFCGRGVTLCDDVLISAEP